MAEKVEQGRNCWGTEERWKSLKESSQREREEPVAKGQVELLGCTDIPLEVCHCKFPVRPVSNGEGLLFSQLQMFKSWDGKGHRLNETRLSLFSKGKQSNGIGRSYKELTTFIRDGAYSA